jgi:hypothetical protein
MLARISAYMYACVMYVMFDAVRSASIGMHICEYVCKYVRKRSNRSCEYANTHMHACVRQAVA